MTIKTGWQGRFFEDFTVGDLYPHPLGRTLTDADNIWFTLLTTNSNPVHFDQPHAARTEFGRMLVDSTLTLAVVTGLSVADVSQNAINLGWEKVRLTHPVFAGDTLRAFSAVLEARPSRSRPSMGIVKVRTTGVNQEGTPVIEFERTVMVPRRGHQSAPPFPGMPGSGSDGLRDGS